MNDFEKLGELVEKHPLGLRAEQKLTAALSEAQELRAENERLKGELEVTTRERNDALRASMEDGNRYYKLKQQIESAEPSK